MHHPLFGHSYAVLVVPILLSTIAFNLLNRKKTSVRRVAEDADTGKSGSSTGPTETNPGPSSSSTADSDGSSSSTALEEINNSASDPLTRPFENRYEVFLSFRGPDTRKGFTDHLYTRLVDAGVRVLRNDDELCQGEEICQDILGAINYAKILIPIISVNYGSSKRCLDELVQIVECKNNNTGHIVLPIFYKVEPTHVRRQIRRFGDAFRTSARCYDPATLKKWKEALVEVSSMKGWEAKGFEGELVKSVVQKVLRELKKKYELDISDNLVGIHSHVGRVMEFVDENPSATIFVGIHGMGGIGKTTLAKAIYNMLFNQFECRSFIADISEYTRQNGLEYLQNKLIFDIMKLKGQVHNKDEGIGLLSSKFKHKRVLILLDGVDDDDQLKALVGNHNWFSSGSRILITTRDKGILDNVGVDYYYEHKELDKDQSSILFNRHAFRRDAAPCELEGATYDVVSATGGLPLSLEVVGSFLRGKPLATWIGAINKLRKIPHDKVQDKLMISFNALDNGQKEIFLDIACFFSGTDRRIPSYMWDACGFSPEEGIEVLQLMSLIKVGDNNELQMHGQLRDLGREIIRQENPYKLEYRSRFWNFEDVLDMLERKEGTKNIKAISLELSRGIAGHGGDIHTDEQFKNLTSLRILHASGAHFIGDFENSMTELRWLRWRYCPSSFEANKFHLKKLAVLDLSRSKILDQWRGWSFIMMAKKLKFLDLTYCRYLKGTSFLSAFTNLEVLILRDCQEVEQIDSSIGDMKSLIILDLTKCRRLKKLPIEVGKLKALEQLLLEDNDKISILPDIGALQNLEILNISGSGIKEFPSGIERLRKLQVLDASRCAVLGGEMPKSIRDLSSLQRLDFQDCQKLQWLPELPFGLIYLSVTCQSRRLPSLSLLNHLKELQILDCRFLECIFELPSTTLELRECSKLTDAQALELPRTLNPPLKLEILKMRGCEFMETLDVSLLNHLKTLSVECCKNILEIRGLGKLKDLESLTITKCTSIERLNLLNIKGLKVLHAEGCENLVEIEGLGRLELLQDLNISWCALIDRLDLTKSKGLMILNAKYCKKLVEIQGLESLEFLKELNISRCALIERLDLSKSERLKILEAKDCEKLVEIQGLNKLKLLEELDISQWTSIKRLDLQESKKLKILHVTNCKNLVKIQDLDKLEFLEKLKISGCASIERLDLPKSKDLKLLHARECRNLVEIQGLDKLKSLEELDVSGCDSIERLDLSKSEHLKTFHNSDCKKLGKVQGLNRLEFSKGYFF